MDILGDFGRKERENHNMARRKAGRILGKIPARTGGSGGKRKKNVSQGGRTYLFPQRMHSVFMTCAENAGRRKNGLIFQGGLFIVEKENVFFILFFGRNEGETFRGNGIKMQRLWKSSKVRLGKL